MCCTLHPCSSINNSWCKSFSFMQVVGPATPGAVRNIALAGSLAEVVRSVRALLQRLPPKAAAALECATIRDRP
jgi:hypothetical protein